MEFGEHVHGPDCAHGPEEIALEAEEEYCAEEAVNDLGKEFDALVSYLEHKGLLTRAEFDAYVDQQMDQDDDADEEEE